MKQFLILLITIPFLYLSFVRNDELKYNSEVFDIEQTVINIGFYPFGNFDTSLLSMLKQEVQVFYGFKVTVLKGSQMPDKAYYKPRNRYRADTLLDYLLEKRPINIDYMVGLTQKDISCTNGKHKDWGIFGLGYMPGRSCIISSYRLKPSAKNESHFRERLTKVVLHELGHNFGLDHCSSNQCIMQDAEGTIKTVDNEHKALCEKCKKQYKKNLRIN